MDNNKLARELVRLAKNIVTSEKNYYTSGNGIVIWTKDKNLISEIVNDLKEISDIYTPTLGRCDDYKFSQQKDTYIWKWFGLFSVALKIKKELNKKGYKENKNITSADKKMTLEEQKKVLKKFLDDVEYILTENLKSADSPFIDADMIAGMIWHQFDTIPEAKKGWNRLKRTSEYLIMY